MLLLPSLLLAASLAQKPLIALPLTLYSLGKAGDLLSTEIALSRGAEEQNPFGKTRTARVALSLGIVAGLTAGDVWLQGRSKKLTWVLRGAVLGVHGYLIWNNIRAASRANSAQTFYQPSFPSVISSY